MELNIKERLVLSGALPREGNLVQMRMIQDLQQKLGFTEEEQELIGFQQEGDQVKWKQGFELVKDIALGPRALVTILDTLQAADLAKKLTLDLLALCDRFGYPEGEQGKVDQLIKVEDLETMLGGPEALAKLVELAKDAQGMADALATGEALDAADLADSAQARVVEKVLNERGETAEQYSERTKREAGEALTARVKEIDADD